MTTLSEEDRENITAYLDGELDEETAQALEARISLDADMRKAFEEMKQAWAMLDYLPKVQPSDTFTHRTMERLSLEGLARAADTAKMPRRAGFSWVRTFGWAAAIVFVAGASFASAYLLLGRERDQADPDEPLVKHLRVLEHWRLFEQTERPDLDFLKALDHPDLFGDEPGS